MKVYEIGYSGYESSSHYILAGDVDISEEEFRDSVREEFRAISIKHVAEISPDDVKSQRYSCAICLLDMLPVVFLNHSSSLSG